MDNNTEKRLLNIVKSNYDIIGKHFSETRKKEIWPELKKIAKQVEENSKILDLGCGNGRLLRAFDSKNLEYFGIDQSESLIEEAMKQFPNDHFLVGDILDLSKIDLKKNKLPKKFNFIFSIAVLQHIPGKKKRIEFLRTLKNYLEPDGVIVFSNWNMWEIPKYKKLVYRTFFLKILRKNSLDFGDVLFDWKNSKGETVSQRYYHAFRKYELRSLFKKAGYKVRKNYKDKFNFYTILSIKT
ncbi:hypothetical protein C0584_00800 [Candidatus Parcubacteria bacterium]|nr:MAG: hypothetical protein C0584_00800 [Candidatus Parcubacteria bacterium]